jgi:indole-3-glycerol phosphate synthase
MNILEEIVASKYKEVADRKAKTSTKQLETGIYFDRPVLSMKKFLIDPSKTGIIAEFKRKSPSKGIINDKVKIEDVVKAYSDGGASGVSVLTDENYFGGSMNDLIKARSVCSCPILRKDFIVDEYQILEAKSIGADVILLIAASLDKNQIKSLSEFAKSLSLEVLLELHEEKEMDKITGTISMIGINNRDLKTFKVNIEQSIKLANKLPKEYIKISESGIDEPATIKYLKNNGYKGFLIGESFMKSDDPGKAFNEFVKQL